MGKLKIGNNEWETVVLTAAFPLDIYKKTGKDILKAEANMLDAPLEFYDTMLNVAFYLSGENDFDVFASKFNCVDLISAYSDIMALYSEQSKPNVESKGEKK